MPTEPFVCHKAEHTWAQRQLFSPCVLREPEMNDPVGDRATFPRLGVFASIKAETYLGISGPEPFL